MMTMHIIEIRVESEEEHLGAELTKQIKEHLAQWIGDVESDGINVEIDIELDVK